jgi:signal transduction histidine kinase
MDTHETKIYLALLIAACVLALLFVIYVISLIKQHQRNVILYKEKVQAEIRALENERSRFVKDLHDDFGPVLSSVKMHVASIHAVSEDDRYLQSKSLGLMNDMLTQIHRIANDLMPNSLERKGLITAIRQFADDLNATGAISVQIEAVTMPFKVEQQNEIHIYRIIQEAIHNTLKHARATQIKIGFSKTEDEIRFYIADNGKGFHYSMRKQQSLGLGLKNIVSRVEMMDGEIFIDTAPGKGTRYEIILPNNMEYES